MCAADALSGRAPLSAAADVAVPQARLGEIGGLPSLARIISLVRQPVVGPPTPHPVENHSLGGPDGARIAQLQQGVANLVRRAAFGAHDRERHGHQPAGLKNDVQQFAEVDFVVSFVADRGLRRLHDVH